MTDTRPNSPSASTQTITSATSLLPHALPLCENARIALFAMRRMGANGLADPPAYVTDRADEWATWIIERLERRADEPAPAPARAVALNDYTWDSAAVPIDDWIAEHTRARATPTVAPSDPESKGPA